MYPFVAKNKMCGRFVTYIELDEDEINKGKSLDLDKLFGFLL
jgi:hypothetical protein